MSLVEVLVEPIPGSDRFRWRLLLADGRPRARSEPLAPEGYESAAKARGAAEGLIEAALHEVHFDIDDEGGEGWFARRLDHNGEEVERQGPFRYHHEAAAHINRKLGRR